MSNLHAHYSSSSVDCDGPFEQSYVMVMNDDERASEFGDIEFHNRVLTNAVSLYSSQFGGTLRVERDEDDGQAMFFWHERTEEGSRSVEARLCTDACDESEYSQRDYYAEMMGY